MNRLRLILAITAATTLAFAESPSSAVHNPDAADNRIVVLPGSAPRQPSTAPVAETASLAIVSAPVPPAATPPPSRAVLAAPQTSYPAEFLRDSAAFLQKKIGQWTDSNCRALLGRPAAARPSFGDNGAETGTIRTFTDSSRRYAKLELGFDRATGRLRTVFAYPRRMSWDDCRGLWGSDVIAAPARNGRTFYSYAARRLDVLVEPSGTVVSLGLY